MSHEELVLSFLAKGDPRRCDTKNNTSHVFGSDDNNGLVAGNDDNNAHDAGSDDDPTYIPPLITLPCNRKTPLMELARRPVTDEQTLWSGHNVHAYLHIVKIFVKFKTRGTRTFTRSAVFVALRFGNSFWNYTLSPEVRSTLLYTRLKLVLIWINHGNIFRHRFGHYSGKLIQYPNSGTM